MDDGGGYGDGYDYDGGHHDSSGHDEHIHGKGSQHHSDPAHANNHEHSQTKSHHKNHGEKQHTHNAYKTANKINDILEEEEKYGFFKKILSRAVKNFKNSTPKMQFVKGTALVGSAILAVSGVKNLISINADKSAEKDPDKKNKSWKEAGKIGVAATITYFSVLRGNGKAVKGGGK